jgi:hypothetical protein
MPLTAHGITDKDLATEEPVASKACPELAEGAHVRFGSGGGVGDRHADHNWAGLSGNIHSPRWVPRAVISVCG